MAWKEKSTEGLAKFLFQLPQAHVWGPAHTCLPVLFHTYFRHELTFLDGLWNLTVGEGTSELMNFNLSANVTINRP